ncbi:hypothetical protein [uncultured Dokdonia sp.]|uniref:hypothetical protein n=1 Tax=uncultured Dokdonia sp. TaxID=575653 RepID=UPI00261718BA|nr:hypothetical protein [uncultured Dokdonia sp.]
MRTLYTIISLLLVTCFVYVLELDEFDGVNSETADLPAKFTDLNSFAPSMCDLNEDFLFQPLHIDNNQDCPDGYKKCGNRCYDPMSQKCDNGVVCQHGQYACGNSCYNPMSQRCINGTICPHGYESCNGKCYDPIKYRCVDGVIRPHGD